MNAKLLFKTIFLLAVLGLLVMIGKNNPGTVSFALPPIVSKVKQPAAMMYYSFFAVGVLTGTILTAGGGAKKSAGASSSPKPAKKDK
jgi:hypothetical protein